MNSTSIAIVSVALVAAGVLAELNLLRVFLREWQENQRQRSKRLSSESRGEAILRDGPSMERRLVAAFAIAPSIGASVAHAQGPASQPPQAATNSTVTTSTESPKAEPAGDPSQDDKSPLSLQLNLDVTNAYFFHGIRQQDHGLIVQPAARLNFNLLEEGDLKVDALVGTWNSFGPNGGSQTSDLVQYWYEADLLAGVVITQDKLSLTTTYTFLTSPSDAYQTVQELDFMLAFDDSALFGKLAIHPYALLGIETNAGGSDGDGTEPGTYLELGIAPGLSFDAGRTPVAITFPTSIGLSLHNYYENAAGDDDTFGFVQVGAKASIPLPVADRWGKWTLNAGISALFLGDTTSSFNGGDDTQLIGTIGAQVNF
ncbi:MAG: hypothetical protein KF745_10845 [Phycisphaeraceae bacterium]|nr:hypothetical protein [Phycisphaeraceae bacterium]